MFVETIVATVFTIPLIMGIHRGFLLWRMWELHRRGFLRDPEAPSLPLDNRGELVWPKITVQLPIFNEKFVARRLIDSVAALDYPKSKLQIQVLDDSTDETSSIIANAVGRYQREGFDIKHIQRKNRDGYKAGALRHGMNCSDGEFIAIFDADFVPYSSFLRRTIPHFYHNRPLWESVSCGELPYKGIGMVQARWEHINRVENALTRVESMLLDAHFAIEHLVRNRSGRFFNFNGTAGVWRRSTIEEAGGWESDTLTEDLDLSYRAQEIGWKFIYLNEVDVPSELPSTMPSFKTQQHRWVKGSIQTAKKELGTLLLSELPFAIKVEAIFHLLANIGFPAILIFSFFLPIWFFYRLQGGGSWFWLDVPFGIATLFFAAFYIVSQRFIGRKVSEWLPFLPLIFLVGIGMSVSNTIAFLEGALGVSTSFIRTPKKGDAFEDDSSCAYHDTDEDNDIIGFSRTTLNRFASVGELALGLWSFAGLFLLNWVSSAPSGTSFVTANLLFSFSFFYVLLAYRE